jgi:RES domain-containing protein
MPKPSPSLRQLKRRLQILLSSAVPFVGTVYRATSPKYATEADLLTGEGSRRYAGRWSPTGLAVVYAAMTPEAAMAESLAHNRYYGIPVEDAMPRTFAGIQVRLNVVLDLRAGEIRQRLQFSERHMLGLDWRKELEAGRQPVSQTIGQAAYEVGFEGLIVPSAARPKGHNLLVFPNKLRQSSKIAILNPEHLHP